MPSFLRRAIGNRAWVIFLVATGCSNGVAGEAGGAREATLAAPLAGDAYTKFDRAFRAMADHDAAEDWTDERCAEVASAFVGAWQVDNTLREALYDAGVAHLRCHHVGEARRHFIASLETSPRLYRGQVRLTMLESYRNAGDLDRAVDDLLAVASASGFTETGVLVDLAARQIERGASTDGANAKADLIAAEQNLSRALSMDAVLPKAWNQLALLHLAYAKAVGRAEATRVPENRCREDQGVAKIADRPASPNRERLERAMGICLQGMREHPTFASVRNTAGLIAYELRDIEAAVHHFEAAANLDPESLDAEANLAAALLATKKFQAAEKSYDRALALRADDYEAYLGRALARRGQITATNFPSQVESVESDLARCKELDPDRPEAYYDDAVFNEHFKAPGVSRDRAMSVLRRARSLFDTFLAKAGQRPEYATEVRLAKQRVHGTASGPLPAAAPECQR